MFICTNNPNHKYTVTTPDGFCPEIECHGIGYLVDEKLMVGLTPIDLTTKNITPITPAAPKPSNWAWILTIIFGAASFILFMMYSSQNQEVQSMQWQLNGAQANIDSAVATAESNARASVLGLNYYRVTLSDFYNGKTYPINNVNGEQIGELYVSYGWAYMENDVPIDSKSLTTVRVIFNIYSESTNGYYGFATQLDDRYDVEERHLPTIGSTHTAETSNYKMAVRVIEFKENQDDYGFNELIVDIVISNK